MALVANTESIVARRDKGLRMEISGFTYQNISEILCNITQTLSFGSLENIFYGARSYDLFTCFLSQNFDRIHPHVLLSNMLTIVLFILQIYETDT